MRGEIRPTICYSDIFEGDNYVISARIDYDATPVLSLDPIVCDLFSATPRTYSGRLPVLCHAAGATPLVDSLLRQAGHRLDSETLTYHDRDSYYRQLKNLCGSGRRLINQHIDPLAPPSIRYANSQSLLSRLNNKALLDRLAHNHKTPRRQVVTLEELANMRFIEPVVLKPVTCYPTGGSLGIKPCSDAVAFDEARSFYAGLSAFIDGVVIEQYLDFGRTWCANVAISGRGITYMGAAVQNCDESGAFLGNIYSSQLEPDETVRKLALDIAETARAAGYLGYAGFDLGQVDGEPVVFDLNFRACASTPQLSFHASMCLERGFSVSRNFRFDCPGDLEQVAGRLQRYLDEKSCVLLACIDGASHESGRSWLLGYILANAEEELDELDSQLFHALRFGFEAGM